MSEIDAAPPASPARARNWSAERRWPGDDVDDYRRGYEDARRGLITTPESSGGVLIDETGYLAGRRLADRARAAGIELPEWPIGRMSAPREVTVGLMVCERRRKR